MAETHYTEKGAPADGLAHLNGAITSEVDEFCRKHNLFDAVALFARLAEKHFSLSEPPTLNVHVDPEWGDSWLLLRVCARGTVDEVVAAHERLLREWIEKVPDWDTNRKVVLSLNIV